jgi:hypothetical protein
MKRRELPPTLRCECEHDSHFNKTNGGPEVITSLSGHAYGVDFPEQHISPVRTPYGTFAVCPACRENCLADYTIEGPSSTTVQVVSTSDVVRLR